MAVRIAICLQTVNELNRQVYRGIARYALRHPEWILYPSGAAGHAAAKIVAWKPQGVFVALATPALARQWLRVCGRLGIALVNVLTPCERGNPPQVLIDEDAVGRLAAEHLLGLGYRNLGFFGWSNSALFRLRKAAFVRVALAAGIRPFSLRGLRFPAHIQIAERAAVAQWLARLPKPIGIFAGSDFCGFGLAEACWRAGLRVPDDVAIVGVDNDEPWCSLARPPLSTILIPAEQIGYQAATLMANLLAGRRPPKAPIRVPPIGIQPRQSTDAVIHADARVVAALRFIRANPQRALRVKDVVNQVGASRRTLELLFRRQIGHSPHAEIERVRIEHLKKLLADMDLSIRELARHCGFRSQNHLAHLFQKHTGRSPSQYRRLLRLKGRT